MLRRLARDSFVYTLSTILTSGLSFVLLPIYARILTPGDYGLYDYIAVIGMLAGVSVALEVTQGVMLFVPQSVDPRERHDVVGAAFWVTVSCYAVFLVLFLGASPWVARVLLGSADEVHLVWLAGAQYLAAALLNLWTVVERAQLRPWRVMAIAVGSATLSGVLGALGAQAHQVEGLLVGQLVGQGSVALVVTVAWSKVLRRGATRRVVRRLVAFSAPLVVSSLAFVLSTYVDRVLVRQQLGLTELGYYAFGARLASGVSLLLVGFQAALTPLIYSRLDTPGVERDVGRVFRLFLAVAVPAYLVLALSAGWLVDLLGGGRFDDAAPVLRLLAAAALVQGSYIFFPGLYIARRTRTLAAIHGLGVAVNAGLNIALIPVLGLVGSGLATLAGGAFIFGTNYLLSRRHFRVDVLGRDRDDPDESRLDASGVAE